MYSLVGVILFLLQRSRPDKRLYSFEEVEVMLVIVGLGGVAVERVETVIDWSLHSRVSSLESRVRARSTVAKL